MNYTDEDVDRINDFIHLEDPDGNKFMIKVWLFLSCAVTLFFIAGGLYLNYGINVFKTPWLICIIGAILLVVWGIWLSHNIWSRQINFLLFTAMSTTFIGLQFYSLSIAISIITGASTFLEQFILYLIQLVLFLLLLRRRYTLFTGKAKAQVGVSNLKLSAAIMLICSPILIQITKDISEEKKEKLLVMAPSFLGAVFFAIGISVFVNYYVARKHENIIELFEKNKKTRINKK